MVIIILIVTSASSYLLKICTRILGPRYGGELPLNIEIKGTYVTTKNMCHMILALIESEYKYPITPIYLLKHVSRTILKFLYFLVVNNNKYLSYVVDKIIFGISVQSKSGFFDIGFFVYRYFLSLSL